MATLTLTAQIVKINPNSTSLAVLSRSSNQLMSLVVLVLEASSKISLNNLIIENISHYLSKYTAGQLTPVVLSRSSDQPMSLNETGKPVSYRRFVVLTIFFHSGVKRICQRVCLTITNINKSTKNCQDTNQQQLNCYSLMIRENMFLSRQPLEMGWQTHHRLVRLVK